MSFSKMFLKLTLSLFVVFSFSLGNSSKSYGATCDQLAGEVIFWDMLYGTGAGLVIGGLALAVAEGDNINTGRSLAGASLAGATLGMAVGVGELVFRDSCPEERISEHKVYSSGRSFALLPVIDVHYGGTMKPHAYSIYFR